MHKFDIATYKHIQVPPHEPKHILIVLPYSSPYSHHSYLHGCHTTTNKQRIRYAECAEVGACCTVVSSRITGFIGFARPLPYVVIKAAIIKRASPRLEVYYNPRARRRFGASRTRRRCNPTRRREEKGRSKFTSFCEPL